jgi:hypothetical protein
MSLLDLRPVTLVAFTAVALSACEPAPKASPTMLVSIVGVHLESIEAVYTVSVEFENLRVRAICHIPVGWTMAAGNPSRRSLIVEGRASSDTYELPNDALKQLNGLLLVEKWAEGIKIDDGPDHEIRALLYVNVRSEPPDGGIHELKASNIVVESADRCPAPRE